MANSKKYLNDDTLKDAFDRVKEYTDKAVNVAKDNAAAVDANALKALQTAEEANARIDGIILASGTGDVQYDKVVATLNSMATDYKGDIYLNPTTNQPDPSLAVRSQIKEIADDIVVVGSSSQIKDRTKIQITANSNDTVEVPTMEEFNALADEVERAKGELNELIEKATFTENYYIKNNVSIGTVVDIIPQPSSTGVCCSVFEVNEGDIVILTAGNNGTNAVTLGVLDNEYKLLYKTGEDYYDKMYVVPKNGAFLTINNSVPSGIVQSAILYHNMPSAEIINARGEYSSLSDRLKYEKEIRVEYDESILCDYFGISTGGLEKSSANFSCTSFIECIEGTDITFTALYINGASEWGYAFYDENKTLLSFVNLHGDERVEIMTIKVPDSAKYFRCTYGNYSNRTNEYHASGIRPFKISIVQNHKKINYQNGYFFFSQRVKQGVNNYWNGGESTQLSDVEKATTGVIALPTTYTADGKPTPLIIYFHGYSHGIWMGNWGNSETFPIQKQHWLDRGFAVMDCNGARDNNKTVHFTSAGSRQYVDGYRKCFEWVREHFNVEHDAYVVGGSAGGLAGINYCQWYSDVKAMCLLSAWSDLKECSWGQGIRDTIKEYLGFANTTDYEQEKTIGFDPALKIITIDNKEYIFNQKIPVMALIGSTETTNMIYTCLNRYITALRNAGNTATLRVIENATHTDVVSGGVQFIDDEVANWFKAN